MDVTTIPQGSGSGFIWDDQGHVVTNYHVIRSASALKVTLFDTSSCSAKVVGFDESKDIAVLKLDIPEKQAKALEKVSLGRSTGLAVGQRVFAIGNPFGLDHTLTSVRCARC
jgi:S1-C subfamily serine protease